MMKTITACYWIVGCNTEPPAVVLQLHRREEDAISDELIECQSIKEARRIAKQHGASEIVYDFDSTEYFAND